MIDSVGVGVGVGVDDEVGDGIALSLAVGVGFAVGFSVGVGGGVLVGVGLSDWSGDRVGLGIVRVAVAGVAGVCVVPEVVELGSPPTERDGDAVGRSVEPSPPHDVMSTATTVSPAARTAPRTKAPPMS